MGRENGGGSCVCEIGGGNGFLQQGKREAKSFWLKAGSRNTGWERKKLLQGKNRHPGGRKDDGGKGEGIKCPHKRDGESPTVIHGGEKKENETPKSKGKKMKKKE